MPSQNFNIFSPPKIRFNFREKLRDKSPFLRFFFYFVSGALLIDEMKLMEGLKYEKASMKISGFVNMGEHTPEDDKNKMGDHALVLIFQPFKGQWIQTVAAFLTKGAAKGKELFAITLDAVARLEQCGLFIDALVSDGASWNRNVWVEYGMIRNQGERDLDDGEDDDLAGLESVEIYKEVADVEHAEVTPTKPLSSRSKNSRPTTLESKMSQSKIKKASAEHRSKFVSCEHPCGQGRRLCFFPDFPHLVKSMKQRVLNGEDLIVRNCNFCFFLFSQKEKVYIFFFSFLQTPDGQVKLSHWESLFQEDSKYEVRVAPKLNWDHFQKVGYITMNVGLGFSVSSFYYFFLLFFFRPNRMLLKTLHKT